MNGVNQKDSGTSEPRPFRNPLKKYLEPPITTNDLACSHRLKVGVYEVPEDYPGPVQYAFESKKNVPKRLNVTHPPDPLAEYMKNLPVETFQSKMKSFLHDGKTYMLNKVSLPKKALEDDICHYVSVGRERYLDLDADNSSLAEGFSKLMAANLKYPVTIFDNADKAVRTLKEDLFTTGWKEVTFCHVYGPDRIYLVQKKTGKSGFDEAFAKWTLEDGHTLAELKPFDGSRGGYFLFYDTDDTFKAVHSLTYPEKPIVLNLDSGEISEVEDIDRQIRMMPDTLLDKFEPVVAARLNRKVSEKCFKEFLDRVTDTSRVYVTGSEGGALLVSTSPGSKNVPDMSTQFCGALNCLGKCAVLKEEAKPKKNPIRLYGA